MEVNREVEVMRFWILAFLTAILIAPVLADQPVAMVTNLKGEATSNGEPLQLLSYLDSGQEAQIGAGSQVVFSYIQGGMRATVTGPCKVSLQPSGPKLTKGKATQIKVKKPKERTGAVLPSNLDLGSGGHLRRGELTLHVSGKLLPGEQVLEFSALPSFKTFYLTITNSSTFTEAFDSGELSVRELTLPSGTLEAGESYDFLLQATSDSGETKEWERQGVVVLSNDVSQKIRSLQSQGETAEDFETRAELLAVYLKHGLDREALGMVKSLLASSDSNARLVEIQNVLLRRMDYVTD